MHHVDHSNLCDFFGHPGLKHLTVVGLLQLVLDCLETGQRMLLIKDHGGEIMLKHPETMCNQFATEERFACSKITVCLSALLLFDLLYLWQECSPVISDCVVLCGCKKAVNVPPFASCAVRDRTFSAAWSLDSQVHG